MDRITYDYHAGRNRVKAILRGKMQVIESGSLPKSDDLTFDNSYKSWIAAIFVDIRDSTKFIAGNDQEAVAKTIRAFTSEVLEILRGEDEQREIGIRGDCVYAIYTAPTKRDTAAVFDKVIWINTYINMLNKMLVDEGLERLRVGIGMAVSEDHVIKAGRKGVGIFDHVWLGEAVSLASKLSGLGEKDGLRRICVSTCAHLNFIDSLKGNNEGKPVDSWFEYCERNGLKFYNCGIIKSNMDEWISSGMPD